MEVTRSHCVVLLRNTLRSSMPHAHAPWRKYDNIATGVDMEQIAPQASCMSLLLISN